jgi:glycosyltransferase involved in cell wall biosynthesis
MKIGILHFKVGATDGVSLEIEKWKQVLEEMGHQVVLCAGDLGMTDGFLIEEMYHHTPESQRLYRNTFIALSDYDETAYQAELNQLAGKIESELRRFIFEEQIDFLIPHNIWSVAANPAVAPAVANAARESGLHTLAHNHDFYWERVDGVALTCATAIELADKFLPPRDPLFKHTVINSLAKKELAARKGIDSLVIPNVFNFTAPDWEVDDYNKDFRERIGLSENDICLLQATRIVPRKGIEMAIDFVQALGSPRRRQLLVERGLYDGRPFTRDNRIVFVIAGYAQDESTGQYLANLKDKIEEAAIDALFIEDIVDEKRQEVGGEKIYSLWDTYVFSDFVTYPSLWEGWGNQLLEALRARLPFLLFEYPVYKEDIKDKGFRAVSLGADVLERDERGLARLSQDGIERAADEAVELLTDNLLRQEMVDYNFNLAQEHYSLASLLDYFEELIGQKDSETV